MTDLPKPGDRVQIWPGRGPIQTVQVEAVTDNLVAYLEVKPDTGELDYPNAMSCETFRQISTIVEPDTSKLVWGLFLAVDGDVRDVIDITGDEDRAEKRALRDGCWLVKLRPSEVIRPVRSVPLVDLGDPDPLVLEHMDELVEAQVAAIAAGRSPVEATEEFVVELRRRVLPLEIVDVSTGDAGHLAGPLGIDGPR